MVDWNHYLQRIERIEHKNKHRRVVCAWIPGGLPEIACNVPNPLMRGGVKVEGGTPHAMRAGVFGSYKVEEGDFMVQFNDGEIVEE